MPLHPSLKRLIDSKLTHVTTPQWAMPIADVREGFRRLWTPGLTGMPDLLSRVEDVTIPTVGTNTSTISSYKFNVDLRHKKRYLRLLVTPITTQSFTAIANLHRGEIVPTSATDVNASVVVSG